jgi:HSP90 family molecular chaperone
MLKRKVIRLNIELSETKNNSKIEIDEVKKESKKEIKAWRK